MQSKMCSQTNRFFLIWVTLVYRCCLSFLLLLRFFLTPQQMQWPLCSDEPGFFHIYFPYRKTPFKCIVFIQLEYCFHFDYLVPQPPHPSTSSIPTVRWNDIQKYSTSIDKNKSAVKLLYWPPHPAFLDSLRQFTPAPPCPGQEIQQHTKGKRDRRELTAVYPDKIPL